MATNGEKLKDARLKLGKSINELSQQTRISVQFLEAIEADQLESIPGEFFRRSFVKQYAQALGQNPEDFQPQAPIEFRSTGGNAESAIPVRMHEQPDLPPLPPISGHRPLPLQQVFLSIGLLLGVLAVCAVAYTVWEDYSARKDQSRSVAQTLDPPPVDGMNRQSAETPSSNPSASDTQPQGVATPADPNASATNAATPANGTPATNDGAPLQTAPAPSSTTTATDPAASANATTSGNAAIHGSGTRELRLSASASTWVQAREGDRTVFVGVINPGQTEVLRVSEGARLLVGNAGGLQVVWQGENVGSIGPLGQVRIVNISSDGVSVAAPAPKPATTTNPTETSTAAPRESR